MAGRNATVRRILDPRLATLITRNVPKLERRIPSRSRVALVEHYGVVNVGSGSSAHFIQWKESEMAESVYKVIELVGTSTESWEKAAAAAVEKASGNLRNLRIAEVAELDIQLENGKVRAYRAKVKVSFKYEGGD